MAVRAPTLLLVAVALVSGGCGPANGPGEPRGPAEQLAAPTLGEVDVDCVPDQQPEICDITLHADPTTSSLAEATEWWLRTARAARLAKPFAYMGNEWTWGNVQVGRVGTLGWMCPGDERLTDHQLYLRTLLRSPARSGGLHSVAEAAARGCHVTELLSIR